jgi:hypothetical protein
MKTWEKLLVAFVLLFLLSVGQWLVERVEENRKKIEACCVEE